MQSGTYLALIARLESIAQELSQTSGVKRANEWSEVESHLRTIADGLREEGLRRRLARTSLPSLLTTFLRLAVSLPPLTSSSTHQSTPIISSTPTTTDETTSSDETQQDLSQSIQDLAILEAKTVGGQDWVAELQDGQGISPEVIGTIKEVGRVAANLVFEDDENRAILMTYQYPASLFQVLAAYASGISGSAQRDAAAIAMIRALVASLLNCVLGDYDGIKLFLLQPSTLAILLDLASAIYTPCRSVSSHESEGDTEVEAGIAGWIWKILEESMAAENASKMITAEILPRLLGPLRSFSATSSDSHTPIKLSSSRDTQKTDLQILTVACQTLEGLSLDRPDLLPAFKAEQSLRTMTSFIEHGAPPLSWFSPNANDEEPTSPTSTISETDTTARSGKPPPTPKEKAEKAVGLGKACIMKVLGEVCGESEVKEEWFWEKLKSWLKVGVEKDGGKEAEGEERHDLVSCALLCFGNSARSEHAAASLLTPFPSITTHSTQPPTPLLTLLLPILAPSTDPKIQHALIGLLKNLSIPAANKSILGEAGVVDKLVGMDVLRKERDLLGSVQGGGVGILKHLAVGNVSNCVRIITSGALEEETSTASQLLALVSRSDDLAIKCESTRIFVNVIKTLYSSNVTGPSSANPTTSDTQSQDLDIRLQAAKAVLEDGRIVRALYGMIGLAGKYSVLVGESALALNLLCRTGTGLRSVAETTLAPLKTDVPESAPLNAMLKLLHPEASSENPPLPAEIKSNVYLLLITIRKAAGVEALKGYEAGRESIGKIVAEGGEGKEAAMLQALGKTWQS